MGDGVTKETLRAEALAWRATAERYRTALEAIYNMTGDVKGEGVDWVGPYTRYQAHKIAAQVLGKKENHDH